MPGAAFSPFDDDGPMWPDAAAEAAFLASETAAAATGKKAASSSADAEEKVSERELPALESLVERVPAETRKLLDELFRARFVKVKKIPRKYLQ